MLQAHGRCHYLFVTMLVSMLLMSAACETYQIRGRVIEGASSSVIVLDRKDPRLSDAQGMGGSRISVELDPQRLSRKDLGTVHSDPDGYFAMPIGEFGAGILEYDVQIIGRSQHHAPAVGQIRLPSAQQRVLIIMGPGRDEDPRPADYLRETLQMSEPYMR